MFCDLEEEGNGWAFFFFFFFAFVWWILFAIVEVDAGSAVAEVAVTVVVGFCRSCFYIILKYCIYYFK